MKRPYPPASLAGVDDLDHPCVPSSELESWLREAFIEEGGVLENEEHAHLRFASIGVLWCAVPNRRHMMAVAGQAEIPAFRGNAWGRARHDQQLVDWFGQVPDFLLTFDPSYAASTDDSSFCALVEHELYHCGQQKDEFGVPKFKMDGSPAFGIRGHDVEEFVGVVRRYGVGAAAGQTANLVAAASKRPEISSFTAAHACGTCLRRAA